MDRTDNNEDIDSVSWENSEKDNKSDAETIDAIFNEAESSYLELEKDEYSIRNDTLEIEDQNKIPEKCTTDDRYFVIDDYEEEEEEEEEEGGEEEKEQKSPKGFLIDYDSLRFRNATLSAKERNHIVDKLRELRSEFRVQMVKNKFLHKNYMNILRNSPSLASALENFDEISIFEDTRYQVALENYVQIVTDIDARRESLTGLLENLEKSYSSMKFQHHEHQTKQFLREMTMGKKMRPANLQQILWNIVVDRLIESQKSRWQDVAKIRLSHVQLHYRLEKLQVKLKDLDNLGPGFSMVDYESLMKKKRVYGDKFEEMKENAAKIGKRNLDLAAIIRHIDEDSEVYSEKVKKKSEDLSSLELKNKIEHCKAVEIARKRTNTFKEITSLREEMGLLDKPYLLFKMESDLAELSKLKKRSEGIKSNIILDEKRLSAHSKHRRSV